MRFLTVFSLSTAVLFVASFLVLVASSQAASLVYLDGEDDLAAARPDGSGARKLVSNNQRKSAISVDGSGRIAYFSDDDASDPYHQLIDKSGKNLAGPFLFGDIGLCGYISPFRSAFSTDGTWLAVTYSHGNSCSSASFTFRTRLIDSDGPTLNGSVYGSFDYLFEPRFLPQNQPLLSGEINNVINIWRAPDDPVMAPWIGLNDPNWDIDSFDFDPTRNRMIMEQSPAGTGSERRDFLILDYEAPGSPNLNGICTRDGLVTSSEQPSRPRYSPDGSQIAWTDPAGIYVSPAPTDNGGTCVISPKLVVPGGSMVEWAPFALTDEPPGGGAELKITAVSGATRVDFRRGMRIRLNVPTAGAVRIRATVTKAAARKLKISPRSKSVVVVATGIGNASAAGAISVKLTPTRKARSAWRKMAGVRITLRARQGNRSATRTLRISR